MDFGSMGSVATTLRRDERDAVAAYLGVAGGNETRRPCQSVLRGPHRELASQPETEWNGWSPSATNTRYQPRDAAGLTIDQVRRLKLKWAYGFDGDILAFAQPTVLDRHLFVGSAGGLVQALNIESGCVQWVFQAAGPVRAAILAVPLGDKHALLFGDQIGWFYALDAETGRLLWKKRPSPTNPSDLRAPQSPTRAPYSSVSHRGKRRRTINPDYPCCTFRGASWRCASRMASQVWKTYTIREKPKQTGKSGRQWGPSGASVWGSPTLDPSEAFSTSPPATTSPTPATAMSDSVLALELTTGTNRLVQTDAARGCLELGLQPKGELPRTRLRLRIFGAARKTRQRPRPAAGRTKVRSGLRARSRQERARSCGRFVSAREALTAACSGAWRATGRRSMPQLRMWSRVPGPMPIHRSAPASSRSEAGRRSDGSAHRHRRKGLVHSAGRLRTEARLQPRPVRCGDRDSRRGVFRFARRPPARLFRRRRQNPVGLRYRARV